MLELLVSNGFDLNEIYSAGLSPRFICNPIFYFQKRIILKDTEICQFFYL